MQYTYLELVKGETEHTHDDGTSGQGHDTHMIRVFTYKDARTLQ